MNRESVPHEERILLRPTSHILSKAIDLVRLLRTHEDTDRAERQARKLVLIIANTWYALRGWIETGVREPNPSQRSPMD